MNTTKSMAPATRLMQSVAQQLLSPSNLGRLVTAVPKVFSIKLTEWVLNSRLQQQLIDGEFQYLEGRKLGIEIKDAKFVLLIGYASSQLCCYDIADGEKKTTCNPDATLAIDSLSAIELLQQTVDPDTLFFQRKLSIRGDTELAHRVKNTLDTLPPEIIPKIARQLMVIYARTLTQVEES